MSDIQALEAVLAHLTVNDFTSATGLRDAVEEAHYLVSEMLGEARRTERLDMLAGARAAMGRTPCA